MDQQALATKRAFSTCLNDLISEVEEEFAALALPAAGLAYAADVTLNTKVRVPKPLDVIGDEEQLYRLVSNLVVNAIQHTPAGCNIFNIL
jgi:signal transduction histidine kinase